MAGFVKFHAFVEALAEKKHNLGSDTLKLMLSNTAPNAATNAAKADIVEIPPGNGYAAGGVALTGVTSAQTGGAYKLDAADSGVTAAGGSVGPFRYIVLYNDTATNEDLIGYWDFGSSVTLADTESFLVQFDAAGILTLA